MKIHGLLAILMVASSNLIYAAGPHDTKPLYEGKVSVIKDVDIELVAKSNELKVYLRDHGKPLEVKRGSAKVTLLHGGATKDYELALKGGHFELTGNFQVPKDTKAIVIVQLNDKAITARYTLD